MLLVAVTGCASAPSAPPMEPDPPLRSFVELPLARDAADQVFADEHAAFELVRRTYVLHGWSEAGAVPLLLNSDAVIPYASEGQVWSPPFLGPVESMHTHLAAVSTGFYEGRLDDYVASFPSTEVAHEAYESFMIAMLLHEMAHAVAQERGLGTTRGDPYFEEMRAIDFELAMLADLVATGQLPPSWPERYRQFNQVLLEAAPAGLIDALPTAEAKRRADFNEHYARMNEARAEAIETGRNPAQGSTDRVLAMYTQRRLEGVASPPALTELRRRLDPPKLDAYVENALKNTGLPYERDGNTLRFSGGSARYEVEIFSGDVYFRGTFGLQVPTERRGAVLELANLLYADERWGRFELTDEGRVVFSFVAHEPENFDAVSLIRRATEAVARRHPSFAAVIDGQQPRAVVEAAREAAQRELEEVAQ